MIKNRKAFYSGILFIIIILLISGYFIQKKYYEMKAIENTRFITSIQSRKAIANANLKDILDTTLYDARWSQSHISGNKYLVSCIGTFDSSIVTVKLYPIDQGKDRMPKFNNKSFYIYKNGKLVNLDYAFNVLLVQYFNQTGKTLTDDLKSFQSFQKFIKVADPDFDTTDINRKSILKYFDGKNFTKEFAKKLLNQIKNGNVTINDLKSIDSQMSNDEFDALVKELNNNGITDNMLIDFLNGLNGKDSNLSDNNQSTYASNNTTENTDPSPSSSVGTTGTLGRNILTNSSYDEKAAVVKESALQGSDKSVEIAFNNYFDNVNFKYSNENTDHLHYLVDVPATKGGTHYDIKITVSYKYNNFYITNCTKDGQNIDPQSMINTIYANK